MAGHKSIEDPAMSTTDENRNATYLAKELATGLAADKDVSVSQSDIPDVAASLKPQLLHLTNNEPWYQSRVTWGAIIMLVSGILALFGYKIEEELQGQIVNGIISVATAIGLLSSPLIVLWGRYVARKPLGS